MVQAARGLLSAVTRVLLLADMVVVKQIISVKKKVRPFVSSAHSYRRIVRLGHVDFEPTGSGHLVFGVRQILRCLRQPNGRVGPSDGRSTKCTFVDIYRSVYKSLSLCSGSERRTPSISTIRFSDHSREVNHAHPHLIQGTSLAGYLPAFPSSFYRCSLVVPSAHRMCSLASMPRSRLRSSSVRTRHGPIDRLRFWLDLIKQQHSHDDLAPDQERDQFRQSPPTIRSTVERLVSMHSIIVVSLVRRGNAQRVVDIEHD